MNPETLRQYDAASWEELDDLQHNLIQDCYQVVFNNLPKIPETYEVAFRLIPMSVQDTEFDPYIRITRNCLDYVIQNESRLNTSPAYNWLVQTLRKLNMLFRYGKIRGEREKKGEEYTQRVLQQRRILGV